MMWMFYVVQVARIMNGPKGKGWSLSRFFWAMLLQG
jgi:hypothetical protein